MKRLLLSKLFAAMMLFAFSWSLYGASTPVVGDGKWYYVKSQRGPSATALFWTVGAGGFVVPADLAKTEAQMFTLVAASEGKVTFNDKAGNTISYDPTDGRQHMKFVGTTPVTEGWTLTSNVVNGTQGWAFPGEATGLHQGNTGSPDQSRLMGTWYDLDDYCTFFFYEATASIELQILIDEAKVLSANATIGSVPGTYPGGAKSRFDTAIATATNSISSTSESVISGAITYLKTEMTVFEGFKIKLAGATPVADDGKWYYVKSQRTASDGLFWTLNQVSEQSNGYYAQAKALTKAENQKFTLVTSSAGKVRFKSFDGKEMKATGEFVETGFTTNGWTLTSQVYNAANTTVSKGVQAWSFPGEGNGLHQNLTGGNTVRSNWYVLSDNCSFYFYEATEDIDLQLLIEQAVVLTTTSVVGDRPGNATQDAIDALATALSEAREKLGATGTALAAAITRLTNAIATFTDAKVKIVETSTAEEPIWYLIKSGNPSNKINGKDVGIYTTGAASQCMWGATTPLNANLLWRFEKHASNDTYKMINAAFPDGDLSGVSYGNANTYWNFKLYPEYEEEFGNQFKIYTSGITLHSENTKKLVSWTSSDGYKDNSAWSFEKVDIATSLTESVDAAKEVLAAAVVGSKAGQYPQVSVDAFKVFIEMVEAWIIDNPTPAAADIFTKMEELAMKTTTFVAMKIDPFDLNMVSGKYLIQTLDGKYVTAASAADRKSATTVEQFTDSCFWDVTRRGEELNSYGITFGGTEENFTDCAIFLDELFRWRLTSVGEGSKYNIDEWTEQKIYGDQAELNDSTLFTINATKGGYHIYNSETGAFQGNSTSPIFNLRLIHIDSIANIDILNEKIEEAKATRDSAAVGEKTGQYAQATVDAFTASLTEIETWITDNPNPAAMAILEKINEVKQATTEFANSVIAPFEVVITNGSYCLQTLDGKFLTSAGTDNTPAAVAETFSDATIWNITRRGEDNSYGITFGGEAADYTDCTNYIDSLFNLRLATAAPYALTTATQIKIYADQATITADTKFAFGNVAGKFFEYTTESGAFDKLSDKAIFNLMLADPSVQGLDDLTANGAKATVVNSMIFVSGAEQVEVFTVAGVKVENKNLKQGVYIAKANGITYKVAVK